MEQRIIYAGIDEAGYGPLLGPLCVALSVLELRVPAGAEATRPDIWAMLAPVVVREIRDAGASNIAINDSKRIKTAGTAKRHPLEHLERGVLSVASCMGREVACDGTLRRALEAEDGSPEWYAGEAIPLPLASTADQLRLACARLAGAGTRAGVRFDSMCCRVCDEAAFNEAVQRGALKSDISFERVSDLLRRVWAGYAAAPDLDEHGPRVVVDRQGGRIAYAHHLARAVPGAEVRPVLERPEASVYDLRGPDGRRMRVTFTIDADLHHFPTALASMCAKFVRELAMMRFNRYWCARIAELKPTAGYGADAVRWLRDVGSRVTPGERRVLKRMA